MYSFRIKEDQHYIISSARDDDDDDDVGGVDIVAKSQRHQELRRSAFCTSCNLQEVSAHKQHQVRLNIQLYPPDASDIDVNTKVKKIPSKLEVAPLYTKCGLDWVSGYPLDWYDY